MTFAHEDSDFDALLRIVAEERGISVALVEKDYWVTHALWALHAQGFDIWFKGGTSLSKGFGLIERFSEDLDLRVDPGRVEGLPAVASWTSERKGWIANRREHFGALAERIVVPGADVGLDLVDMDDRWRMANVIVRYEGRHLGHLPSDMKPFVLLEVGRARIAPYVRRDLSSFVHDALDARDQLLLFDENRPMAVRCVHPLVTLIEKLEALMRRAARDDVDPAGFVRHYEDAARIIRGTSDFPALEDHDGPRGLMEAMYREQDIRQTPVAGDPAFCVRGHPRETAIRAANERIQAMFWGPRIDLDEACDTIRAWVSSELGPPPGDGVGRRTE